MDAIQHKIRKQNYVIKGICSKNKLMNITLMKQLIIFVAFLILNTIIFILLFSPQLCSFILKRKTGKNLKKIDKRKLEDDWSTEEEISDESDIYTDTNTDIDTYIANSTPTYSQINNGLVSNAKDINTTNNFNNCSAVKFFNSSCYPYNKDKEDDTEYINHIIDEIQEGKFKELFNRTIEEDKNYIREDHDITYQISTVSSQYMTNLSKVSLEKCECILKDAYSIDKEEKLILLKLEHYVQNIKIPIIEYQLFTKDGQKLNLSCYNEIPELISIPVDIDESEEFIHDPNSDFYEDRCFIYTSEYDTDLTLYDRKKNFNEKFLSLCEKNCIYKGYNKSNKTANCECKTKNEFPKFSSEKLDLLNLLYRFLEVNKKYTNFFVLTCTKVLFTSKGFKTNFGSYYNIAIIVVIVILIILLYSKGYQSFQKKIEDIINRKFSENYKNDSKEKNNNKYSKVEPTITFNTYNAYNPTNNNELQLNKDLNFNTSDNLNSKTKFYNDYEMNNL